jgi:hypothetical protein
MQQIAAFLIVAVATAYVLWSTVKRLRGGKARRDLSACASGCESCRRCR